MVQPTGLLSRRFGNKDTDPRIGSRYFGLSSTPLGTDNADVQVFLKAHNERNLAEYEGRVDIDAKLLGDLIRCTKKLETAVGKLTPPAAA
jgi:hypothetical protein